MTIDTSPAALAKLRTRYATYAFNKDDVELVLALLDALEEARAERDKIRDLYSKARREYSGWLDEIPAAAPPAGADEHAAAQTGEDQ